MTSLPTPSGLSASDPLTDQPAQPAQGESQGVFTVHLHSSAYATRQRLENDRAINAAVQVLRRRHQLKDASAYAMLVQASADSRLSLHDKARRLLDEVRAASPFGASGLLEG